MKTIAASKEFGFNCGLVFFLPEVLLSEIYICVVDPNIFSLTDM